MDDTRFAVLRTPRRACVRGEDYAAYRTEVLDIVKELHRAQLVSHAFSRCLEQHCRSRMGVPAFDGATWCVFVCARWSARGRPAPPRALVCGATRRNFPQRSNCVPGSTKIDCLCSWEHRYCLIVLPEAHISLVCAPGSTNTAFLSDNFLLLAVPCSD